MFFSTASQDLLTLEVEKEAWERRIVVIVGNLRTVTVVYWVNVSENSGTGSLGLSWIKSH